MRALEQMRVFVFELWMNGDVTVDWLLFLIVKELILRYDDNNNESGKFQKHKTSADYEINI